ncbi:MAG: hypothetical protein JWR21_2958 [Herminiimonas sp.]|nr:hypothetical protein [Herminiimonas sp.]
MSHVFTRQALYALVWSEPMSKLAKRFGISDVGPSKACAKAKTPKPSLGVEAGLNVAKTPLPTRGPGMGDEVEFNGKADNEGESSTPSEIEPYSQREFGDIGDVENRVRAAVSTVTVPKSISNPHRYIARLLATDEARREKQRRADCLPRLHAAYSLKYWLSASH